MSHGFIPFSKPSISQEAIDEVITCLKSGNLTTGPLVSTFTENLKTYFSAPLVLPLASATAGLHLALLAINLQPGDEVITTPLTFVATLNTIVLAGGKPILVDIDPHTFNMDIAKIEAAITPKTRAIVPVHFAGLPLDLDPLYALAKHYHLRIIEDCCHAIGATYKNKLLGSFGDTQVFSFHANKNITTGEGGCVVSSDQELIAQIERLHFHGIDREARSQFNNREDYEVVLPGFKYNMSDLQAAIGIHQLKELPLFLERRKELAERYQEALSDWSQWLLPIKPDYTHEHAWHLYTPLLNEEATDVSRDRFMMLMSENQVGTGLHYRVAHLYPYYRQAFKFNPGDFPHAEHISERIISLPLFPAMTDADHDRVLDVMYNIFN